MAEKIVLLGARGMLGSDLLSLCAKDNITALDLPDFDITDKTQLEKALENANVVINCAAFTDVEKSESQYDLDRKSVV
jgi:dTDP-4-dehydrorhamnose reductase